MIFKMFRKKGCGISGFGIGQNEDFKMEISNLEVLLCRGCSIFVCFVFVVVIVVCFFLPFLNNQPDDIVVMCFHWKTCSVNCYFFH